MITNAKLKIIHPFPGNDDDKNIYNGRTEEDCAYLSPALYKKIFGKKRSEDCEGRKRLAVVKIISNATGRTIYRQYCGLNLPTNPNPIVAISQRSLRLLSDDDDAKVLDSTVTVKKGCKLCYYWEHPCHATRISTIFGVISIILAIVATVISIVV